MQTIGDRITYCRSTIGLTRNELASTWGGASVPTIARWELNNIKPSKTKVEALSNYFCQKGLIVTKQWIEDGDGVQPSLLNLQEFEEDNFDEVCENTFLKINQSTKNFIFYKVTSNYFSPIIRYGDYVGGIKLDKDSLPEHLNSLIFVVHENVVNVGFLDNCDEITLKNSQGKCIQYQDYSYLVKVIWTAMRP